MDKLKSFISRVPWCKIFVLLIATYQVYFITSVSDAYSFAVGTEEKLNVIFQVAYATLNISIIWLIYQLYLTSKR